MTSYNYALYIGRAISSVLQQTFEDWELLIVDDCSTDDSWKIIKGFDDPRISAVRHGENRGACAAYNEALSLATGAAIGCLDSDDLYVPDKLERQARFLDEHPVVGICGSFVAEIDQQGQPVGDAGRYASWFNVGSDLNAPECWLAQNRLCHSSVVIRTEDHRRVGGFDRRLTYTPDYQFWLRALADGVRVAVIPEPLTFYRGHGSNITDREPGRALIEHALIASEVLFPWLHRIGRSDLMPSAMLNLIGYATASPEVWRQVGEKLHAGPCARESAIALAELAGVNYKELRELVEDRARLAARLGAVEAELAVYRRVFGPRPG